MAFPNKSDDFPHLFSVITRPERKTIQPQRDGRKRRRRRQA
jgi:hypothetical protein